MLYKDDVQVNVAERTFLNKVLAHGGHFYMSSTGQCSDERHM